MKCTVLAAVVACAIALPAADRSWMEDLTPITAADWNYDRAGHLLERAGFGGTPAEIERMAAMSPQDAVSHLVYYQKVGVRSESYNIFRGVNSGGIQTL